jgi:hypothetical protein
MTQKKQNTPEPLSELLTLVRQMSNRLEAIASQHAPDWQLPLYAYLITERANWPDRIGAAVLHSDQHGPTKVVWCGHTYTRRTGNDRKYGTAIWFSRGIGNKQYARLITFSDSAHAEALPAYVIEALEAYR